MDRAVTTIDVPSLVALCRTIARAGCEIIRDVTAGGELGARDKGGSANAAGEYVADAQTEADRRVEAMAMATLRKYAPSSLRVVAEESFENACAFDATAALDLDAGGTEASAAERAEFAPDLRRPIDASRVALYCDPLDGTNEYAAGEREAITVLIGIAVDGVPRAGVIGQPFYNYGSGKPLGRVVWGGAGMGVRGLDIAENASAPPLPPHGKHVVAVNRNIRENRQAPVLETLRSSADIVISATGYHYLMLLERRAHSALLLRKASKKWDTCAGEALLRATGGIVTDTAGRRYDYSYNLDALPNLSGMVASLDVGLHCEMTAIIRDVIKPLGDYPYDVVDPSVRAGVLDGLATPEGGWRGVTVDAGGCLIEPSERVGDVYARHAAALGCAHVTNESASRLFKEAFGMYRGAEGADAMRYYGDGKSFWRRVVRHVLTEANARPIDDAVVESMLNDLYAYYERPSSWNVALGAVDAITRLRRSGVRVALASNWDARLPSLLRALNLDAHFDAVVVSALEKCEKPDPKFFTALSNALDVDPRAIIHVGDDVRNDLRGAASAGFGAAILWSSTSIDGVLNRTNDFNELTDAVLHANRAHDVHRFYFHAPAVDAVVDA